MEERRNPGPDPVAGAAAGARVVPDAAGEPADERVRRLVFLLVAALGLGALATLLAGDLGSDKEPVHVEPAALEDALADAPWLVGVYGGQAEAEVAAGNTAAARRDLDRVIGRYPEHPGTRLYRARLLAQAGAAPGTADGETALADLVVAERGFRRQAAALAAAAPHRPAPAPALAAVVREIARLRAAVLARPAAGDGPH